MECNIAARVASHTGAPASERDLARCNLEQVGCDQCQLVARLDGGQMHRARDCTGKTTGIIARCNRPGIFLRIQFGIHRDVARLQAQYIGHDLRAHGAVALALRCRGNHDADGAQGVDADSGTGIGAALARCAGVSAVVMYPMFDIDGSTMAA